MNHIYFLTMLYEEKPKFGMTVFTAHEATLAKIDLYEAICFQYADEGWVVNDKIIIFESEESIDFLESELSKNLPVNLGWVLADMTGKLDKTTLKISTVNSSTNYDEIMKFKKWISTFRFECDDSKPEAKPESRIDIIFKKVKDSGMDSLTKEEIKIIEDWSNK